MKRRRTDANLELEEERDDATEKILPEKGFNHSPYSGIAARTHAAHAKPFGCRRFCEEYQLRWREYGGLRARNPDKVS